VRDDLTIDKLLTDDYRKDIADMLVDSTIKDISVVFSKGSELKWYATYPVSHLIGIGEIISDAAREQLSCEVEE
jgi:hypothetical protein